jgi:hypothetical protein
MRVLRILGLTLALLGGVAVMTMAVLTPAQAEDQKSHHEKDKNQGK